MIRTRKTVSILRVNAGHHAEPVARALRDLGVQVDDVASTRYVDFRISVPAATDWRSSLARYPLDLRDVELVRWE